MQVTIQGKKIVRWSIDLELVKHVLLREKGGLWDFKVPSFIFNCYKSHVIFICLVLGFAGLKEVSESHLHCKGNLSLPKDFYKVKCKQTM